MIPSQLCPRCPLGPLAAAMQQTLADVSAMARACIEPPRVSGPVCDGPEPAEPDALTRRQWDVLLRIADGWEASAIGKDLLISEATVYTHIRRLYRKLGVQDRAHAVHVAWQRGYLGKEEM